MGSSAPWADSLDIIALHLVNILLGINPMGLIAPWEDSLEIIDFNPIK